ncbi:MAG: hypothetical protein KF795_00135 [Labilithrix sp.]|nr:hypothetical protein [Labilithrix sp.]
MGHNVAYDMAVICERFPALRPLVFRAYDDDRVTDTQLREQLLDIAGGSYRYRIDKRGRRVEKRYTLEAVADRRTGIKLQKDGWRLSYGEFQDVPLTGWPTRAREVQARARQRLASLPDPETIPRKERTPALLEEIKNLRGLVDSAPEQCLRYPLDDARATFAVYEAQEIHARYLNDQFRQARAAFWLHLSSAWGAKTNAEGVESLRREIEALLAETEDDLKLAGLVRANGTRDTKVAKARMIEICARERLDLVRTEAHFEDDAPCKGADDCREHVCLDADACERSGDDVLISYAELTTYRKVLSNDVKALAGGTYWPIHTRYGLAETGRTTSSKPNVQNWARGRKCKACGSKGCELCGGTGTLDGAREAFIPRPGRVFAQADFPQLELYTLAQCCVSWLGKSRLADALNAGLDPHLSVAALILGTTYEDAKKNKATREVKEARGAGKVANFGFPGGLGIDSLVSYAKKSYGVVLTRDQAKRLKEHWFEAWPEMPHYFARINALCDNAANRAVVETLFTKRIRGNATYCAACNNGFQALGADCAKNAGWRITRAAYVDQASPLFNARIVAFVHDEFIAEVDDATSAHDAAHELARLMVEGANVYLPDVPIPMSKMEPLLMRRWSKKAEPRFGKEGRLVPWE